MPLQSDALLKLLSDRLCPSLALCGMIEDLLPNALSAAQEVRALSDHLRDLPDASDVSEEVSKNYGRLQSVLGDSCTAIDDGIQRQFHDVGTLYDQECRSALAQAGHVPEVLADVLWEWAGLGNQVIQTGHRHFLPRSNEGRTWRTSRAEGFWGAVFEHLTPDQLPSLPSGPLLDWGLARHVLVQRANRQTVAGLPALRPWLDHLHTIGQQLLHPDNQWTCDPLRQIIVAPSADLIASNVLDPRPIDQRRDDHWRQVPKKGHAMEAWLSEVPPPPVDPARFDWAARLTQIKGKSMKEKSESDLLDHLVAGFDPATLNAWLANPVVAPHEKSASILMADMDAMGLETITRAWRAQDRERRSLTLEIQRANRPRHRP